MKWKCYLTVFKAKSPIHIGYKQVGFLKTTRYYVTGRAMWGAITSVLAKFLSPESPKYETVGELVKNYIRTSYFFPAVEKSRAGNPNNLSDLLVEDYLVFLPEYSKEGLKFGKLSKEEFEQKFISSFVSTALETNRSAEEGSLHEIEYISDRIKINDKIADVYWIGYIFAEDGVNYKSLKVRCEEDDVKIEGETEEVGLKSVLDKIQVGGERNYGFGRVHLKNFKKADKVFDFDLSLNDKDPTLTLEEKGTPAHLMYKNNIRELQGEIEPLVGLEWSDRGAGQKVSKAKICISPGNILSVSCEIKEYGILYIKLNN